MCAQVGRRGRRPASLPITRIGGCRFVPPSWLPTPTPPDTSLSTAAWPPPHPPACPAACPPAACPPAAAGAGGAGTWLHRQHRRRRGLPQLRRQHGWATAAQLQLAAHACTRKFGPEPAGRRSRGLLPIRLRHACPSVLTPCIGLASLRPSAAVERVYDHGQLKYGGAAAAAARRKAAAATPPSADELQDTY